jgi:uncharacterized membrane protein
MGKGRLEAFSDGVMAVIITILVRICASSARSTSPAVTQGP